MRGTDYTVVADYETDASGCKYICPKNNFVVNIYPWWTNPTYVGGHNYLTDKPKQSIFYRLA